MILNSELETYIPIYNATEAWYQNHKVKSFDSSDCLKIRIYESMAPVSNLCGCMSDFLHFLKVIEADDVILLTNAVVCDVLLPWLVGVSVLSNNTRQLFFSISCDFKVTSHLAQVDSFRFKN